MSLIRGIRQCWPPCTRSQVKEGLVLPWLQRVLHKGLQAGLADVLAEDLAGGGWSHPEETSGGPGRLVVCCLGTGTVKTTVTAQLFFCLFCNWEGDDN